METIVHEQIKKNIEKISKQIRDKVSESINNFYISENARYRVNDHLSVINMYNFISDNYDSTVLDQEINSEQLNNITDTLYKKIKEEDKNWFYRRHRYTARFSRIYGRNLVAGRCIDEIWNMIINDVHGYHLSISEYKKLKQWIEDNRVQNEIFENIRKKFGLYGTNKDETNQYSKQIYKDKLFSIKNPQPQGEPNMENNPFPASIFSMDNTITKRMLEINKLQTAIYNKIDQEYRHNNISYQESQQLFSFLKDPSVQDTLGGYIEKYKDSNSALVDMIVSKAVYNLRKRNEYTNQSIRNQCEMSIRKASEQFPIVATPNEEYRKYVTFLTVWNDTHPSQYPINPMKIPASECKKLISLINKYYNDENYTDIRTFINTIREMYIDTQINNQSEFYAIIREKVRSRLFDKYLTDANKKEMLPTIILLVDKCFMDMNTLIKQASDVSDTEARNLCAQCLIESIMSIVSKQCDKHIEQVNSSIHPTPTNGFTGIVTNIADEVTSRIKDINDTKGDKTSTEILKSQSSLIDEINTMVQDRQKQADVINGINKGMNKPDIITDDNEITPPHVDVQTPPPPSNEQINPIDRDLTILTNGLKKSSTEEPGQGLEFEDDEEITKENTEK